ncbi:MAG: hypothetical protein HGA78_09555, partial [Nitrospirales bacterium]|nr:hypothetical protein [Nitrospirales bacterium]
PLKEPLQGYLRYLTSRKLLQESLPAWKRLESLGPDIAEYLSYTDFLIRSDEIGAALSVWEDLLRKRNLAGHEGIWNGDFAVEPLNGGFDWKTGKAAGVKVERVKDSRSHGGYAMKADFDGRHNPNITVISQTVSVRASQKYSLTGWLRTEGITTTNGAYMEIAHSGNKSSLAKTAVMTGTNPWTELELEFTVPADCKAITIMVRRAASSKFDNKIGGALWMDSFSLRER